VRYSRGYIALSDASDVPLLLHIRNSRAICFDQLRDLILHDCAGIAAGSLRWRIARMEKAGIVQRFPETRHLGRPVLGITQPGLAFLESRGHSLLSLPSTTERILHPLQVPHALELVSIRLALMNSGVLRVWKCELEITSRNLVLDGNPAKDYDAIAEVEIEGTVYRFAIEYERSPKAATRYRAIREILDKDETAGTVLYLAANDDLLYLLALELRATRKRIGFALSESFRHSPLDTRMLTNTVNSEIVSMRELLVEEKPTPAAAL
jgi:hypothetical protein